MKELFFFSYELFFFQTVFNLPNFSQDKEKNMQVLTTFITSEVSQARTAMQCVQSVITP